MNESVMPDVLRHMWSVITHDLKGSLGSISGNVDYLQKNMLPVLLDAYEKALAAGLDVRQMRPDQLALCIDTLPATQCSVNRIRQYLSRMSYKLGAQECPATLVSVAIHTCIKTAIEQYRSGSKLPTEVSLENSKLWGHEETIFHIVYELLANAQYALSEGDALEPKILINGVQDGDHYVISIANNGLSIPSSDIPHLFEPYFSTHDGVGLGLSFCQAAMQTMGGTITYNLTNPPLTQWILTFRRSEE